MNNLKSGFRILVIDDEPFMFKLLGHNLSKLGFIRVTSCNSGHGALGYRKPESPMKVVASETPWGTCYKVNVYVADRIRKYGCFPDGWRRAGHLC